MRKEVLRTCVVTREKLPKEELIRVVTTKDGVVSVDLTGRANGKGAYLKKDSEVIKKALKNKVLNKVLKTDVPDSIYEELSNII